MLLDTDAAAAARHAGDILAAWPQHEEARLLLAAACRRLDDPTRARQVLEPLAGAHPESPVMQYELGRAYAAEGRGDDALCAFQRAVDLDAGFADGWRELAAQHFLAGHHQRGDAAYAKYGRLTPDPPGLTDAHVALAADRLDAAEAMVRSYLRQARDDVAALRLLATLATRRGNHREAERLLNQCLALTPGNVLARSDLARLLHAQERAADALPVIERLIAAEPLNTRHLALKAQVIRLQGRSNEAIALMEDVVGTSPEDAELWLVFGNLLREVGELSRAVEAYRHALSAQPGYGEAYWALANLKTVRFTPEDIVQMQRQLQGAPALGAARIHLEFALGKAFEDEGQYAASFEHYANGNARQRATIEYDPAATSDYVRRATMMYTAGFFADRAGWGSERNDPIFVVGLPRSASTLLEQILASHSQIEGTRELPELPGIVMELAARTHGTEQLEYPEPVAALRRDEFESLAARYLERTAAHRLRGAPRFIDKMLGNFSHVGLIHLMFPRAAIIDARRHPLGCCFSCYKQLFARGMNFSYDLGEMGQYYRDYAALMEHLDAVLPPGRVHRVHYEQLVAEPEREVRRLLDYCGLRFEADCLRFYDNPRIVQTVSSEQVRRPIYTEGVEQWRHFEPWLSPLKDALAHRLEDYPLPK